MENPDKEGKKDEVLECPICFEAYEDPKQLPCLHTFCLKCLEKLRETNPTIGNSQCPLCRQDFSIPNSGFSLFKTNEFISRLIEEKKKLQDNSNELNNCGLCFEIGEEIQATSYCTECKYLCEK